MSNGNGNGVPSKIVELIISNINELTKQVQSAPDKIADDISRDLENVNRSISDVYTKVTTPPRNEELAEKLDNIKIDTSDIKEKIDTLNRTAKWLFTSIWVVTIVLSIAFFVASFYVTYSNNDLVEKLKETSKIEQSINER